MNRYEIWLAENPLVLRIGGTYCLEEIPTGHWARFSRGGRPYQVLGGTYMHIKGSVCLTDERGGLGWAEKESECIYLGPAIQ